jgi:hypothetical protein
MKHLIPIGLAFSGAYLIGLPLSSHIAVAGTIARLASTGSGVSGSTFLAAPYLHVFIPWIAGLILIFFAIRLALRSYRD